MKFQNYAPRRLANFRDAAPPISWYYWIVPLLFVTEALGVTRFVKGRR